MLIGLVIKMTDMSMWHSALLLKKQFGSEDSVLLDLKVALDGPTVIIG